MLAVAVMHGVAHLCADQGFVTEVVVAGDKRVPLLALGRAPEHGSQADRAQVVAGSRAAVPAARRYRVRRSLARRGCAPTSAVAGRSARPCAWPAWSTRAIMSLSPPSGLYQPMRRQERFRQGEAVQGGRPGDERAQHAISSARSRARSSGTRSAGSCRRHQGAPAGLAHRPGQPLGQVRRRATTIGRAGLEPLLQPAVHVDVVQRQCFHHRVHQRGELRHPSCAIGAERQAPSDDRAAQRALGKIIVHRHRGRCRNTLRPSRWFSNERSGLASRAVLCRGQLLCGGGEQALDLAFERPLCGFKRLVLLFQTGFVMRQPFLFSRYIAAMSPSHGSQHCASVVCPAAQSIKSRLW